MLVSTDQGVVGLVSKVADDSQDAARTLLRLGVYEALCDITDALQPHYERHMAEYVAKRSEDGRRALVRTFVERRLAGEDVDDLIRGAEYLTLVEVGKADGAGIVDADPKHPGALGRDTRTGRFARLGSALDRAVSGTKTGVEVIDQDDRYKQAAALGRVLSSTGEPVLGGAVQAAAALGPEAERVLGPGIQRAAYRFRGTEKRPSDKLMNAITAPGPNGARGLTQVTAAAHAFHTEEGRTGDSRAMAVRGDAVAAYFRTQLPTAEQAELSLASGRVPPSRGAIIDADGDIVTEAVGLNGDHYVPFDLKNLGRLEGGQYVRTRAAGGPTREDLYTGLLSGARQMQIVSHSGVFTVELDPDLRGGRRYSDKARGMVKRYQQILETVNSGAVAEVDLPQEVKQGLRQRAMASTSSPEAARTRYNELVQAKIAEDSFLQEDRPDEDELEEAATNRVEAEARQAGVRLTTPERRKLVADEKRRLIRDGKANPTPRALRLDGEGYRRALETLKGEYPQFIRDVRHETLRDFTMTRGIGSGAAQPGRGATDRGFVRGDRNLAAPGGVRADRDYAATRGARPGAQPPAEDDAAAPAQQRQQGAAQPGQRPSSGPEIKTETQGEGGVPVVVVPASQKQNPPSLEDLLKGEEGRALTATMAEDFELLDEAALYTHTADEKDPENLKSAGGAAIVNYAFRGPGGLNGQRGVNWLLTQATDEQKLKAAAALDDLETTIRDAARAKPDSAALKRLSDQGADIGVAADQIATMVRATVKGAPATPESLTKIIGPQDQPLRFAQVDDLGLSVQNHDAWEKQAAAVSPLLASKLAAYKSSVRPHKDIQAQAAELTRLKRFAADDSENPYTEGLPDGVSTKAQAADRIAQLEKTLPVSHLAWSYLQSRENAERLTETLYGSQSQEGEQAPPFAPSEQVRAKKSDSRPVRRLRPSVVRKQHRSSQLEDALLAAWAVSSR